MALILYPKLPIFNTSAATTTTSKPSKLMLLPAELREEIYLQSFSLPLPPIDLASIKDTPDHVPIPAICQLSRQTRKEALALFFRQRTLLISLNCDRNIKRAYSWIETSPSEIIAGTIVITGTGPRLERGETYSITITCSKKEPHFTVTARRAASNGSYEVARKMRDEVEKFLRSVGGSEGEVTDLMLMMVLDSVRMCAGTATWGPARVR